MNTNTVPSFFKWANNSCAFDTASALIYWTVKQCMNPSQQILFFAQLFTPAFTDFFANFDLWDAAAWTSLERKNNSLFDTWVAQINGGTRDNWQKYQNLRHVLQDYMSEGFTSIPMHSSTYNETLIGCSKMEDRCNSDATVFCKCETHASADR